MRFERVGQLQEKAVPVDQACCVLAVSRSGYCAARKRRQVRPAVCANHAEATSDIADYSVDFYNNVRLHSESGNLPPDAVEHPSAIKQPEVVSEITRSGQSAVKQS